MRIRTKARVLTREHASPLGEGGFEPPWDKPAGLQPAAFDRSATRPTQAQHLAREGYGEAGFTPI